MSSRNYNKVLKYLSRASDGTRCFGIKENPINKDKYILEQYKMDEDNVMRKLVYEVRNDHKENINDEVIDEIVVRRARSSKDVASLVRIQEALWSSDCWDPEMYMLNYNLSPSYIIESKSQNTVLGYLVTRLVPIKADSEYTYSSVYFGDIEEVRKYESDGFKIGITFDDAFLANSIKIKKIGRVLVDKIREFILENNIKYSTAITNDYSKKLVDRHLRDITTYIEEDDDPSYVSSFSESEGRPPKLPKGLISENVKITYKL